MFESEQKLKPCPFCGGKAESGIMPMSDDFDDFSAAVFCKNPKCEAIVMVDHKKSAYEARAAVENKWNRRDG